MERTFRIARMSPAVKLLTTLLLAVPPLLLAVGWAQDQLWLSAVGVQIALLYAALWLLARPLDFQVTRDALEIRWPLRRQRVRRADITAVWAVSESTGLGEGLGARLVRVGAGGLWGTFGLLWTSRRGWVTCYASRFDGLVVVERRGARPLLLSPDDPQAFVELLDAPPATRGAFRATTRPP
jgi:hypothetical protein